MGLIRRVIPSLHGTVDVERVEDPPSMIMAYIRKNKSSVPEERPQVVMEIEMFARMSLLSGSLQAAVTKELLNLGEVVLTHKDTIAERDKIPGGSQ